MVSKADTVFISFLAQI